MKPTVRLDDLTAQPPISWEFKAPVASGRADRLSEVTAVLAAAEDRSERLGEWVVFVVAYEASPAFDPAMRTKPAPPSGTPFVWWASFADREQVEPLVPLRTHVVERHRDANRMQYPLAVEQIRRRIELGDVYQVCMTDRFGGSFTGDPFEVYAGLIGVQSCSHGAYVDMGDRVVTSASPELFFRVEKNTVRCRPMKGTAPRHPRPASDREVGDALTRSAKDRAENVMIVDLLRNDLSRIATSGSVEVPELFRLERYETVWQLTSTVTAEVRPDLGLVELLAALFPCGSITGAPKIAAMSIIDELEAEPRGVYCGTIGVLSPPGHEPRVECSVPIRTAVLDPTAGTFVYGSGGGITWSSDPVAEDDEVRAKARILTRSHRSFRLLETMRIDAGGPSNVELHLDRLQDSADWFGFPCDRARIERALRAPVQSSRLSVAPIPGRMRLLLDKDGSFEIDCGPLAKSSNPVVLAIDTAVTASDDPFCCHKTTYRRHYADTLERHPGSDDVVLVNEFGNAIETTIANLLFRLGYDWYTPPLDDGGLPGIGRAVALRDGLITERSIAATELATCDELAVISDLRGWRSAVLR